MIKEVADGIVAWIDPDPRFGHPNLSAIIEDDGITVVDAGPVPRLAEPFAAALDEFGIPVRRLVHTSSHIEYVGGSARFGLAAVYGTPEISAHLDQPPNTTGYQHLLPELAEEFAEMVSRPVTHTVTEAAWISSRAVVAPIGGQITQNLVVQIPDANVVVAGAMCSFGVVPVAFGGDPLLWADNLEQVLEWGEIIVPGHGPIGGAAQIAEQQAYLRACATAPSIDHIDEGPWDHWAGREFTPSNIERAAMLAVDNPEPPPSILQLMGFST